MFSHAIPVVKSCLLAIFLVFMFSVADAQIRSQASLLSITNEGVFAIHDGKGLYFYDREGSPPKLIREGDFKALATNGNVMYLADNNNFFFSNDGGTTWSNIQSKVERTGIDRLFIFGSRVFACDYTFAAYSDDDGQTWNRIKMGKDFVSFRDMVQTGSTIVAATTQLGVLTSKDNGTTWTKQNKGLPKAGKYVQQIVDVAIDGDTWYAAAIDAGVFSSTDNGLSWELKTSNLPEHQYKTYKVKKILPVGDRVIVAIDFQDYLYASDDNGMNWVRLDNPDVPGKHYYNSTSATVHDKILYRGTYQGEIFTSEDFGKTWSIYNTPSDKRAAQESAAKEKNAKDSLFWNSMSFKSEVVFTNDDGKSWTRNDPKAEIKGFKVLASDGNTLYAGTTGTVYEVTAMIVHGKSLYTGGFGGIFRSDDNGKTFIRIDKGLKRFSLANVLVNDGNTLYAATNEGLQFTDIKNIDWKWIDTKHIQEKNLKSLAVKGNKIATASDKFLYVSNDSGVTWSRTPAPDGADFLSLLIIDDKIIAGADHGIYITTDDGKNWSEKGKSIHGVEAFTVNGSDLYMGTSFGVYKSTNGGERWVSFNEGLPIEDIDIKSLVVHNGTVFAGLVEGPIFKLVDGKKWENVANGLEVVEKAKKKYEVEYTMLGSQYNLTISGAKLGDFASIRIKNDNAFDVKIKVQIAFTCQDINVGNITTRTAVKAFVMDVPANSVVDDRFSGCNELTLGWALDLWEKL